jgi:imidazolonepropionase-like amidohydrolase
MVAMQPSDEVRTHDDGGTSFLILDADVRTVSGERYNPGCVFVKGGRIAHVGIAADVSGSVPRLEADGLVLIPGLIDAHSHIGLLGEPELPATQDSNETSRSVTPELRADDAFDPFASALRRVVRGGVTAAYTQPGSANVVGGLGTVVKTYAKDAQHHVLPGTGHMSLSLGENPKEFHGVRHGRTPITRMAEVALVRDVLQQAAAWQGDPGKEPSAVHVLKGLLDKRIKARIHCLRADDILSAIRVGEEFHLDYVLEGVLEGWKVIDAIANSGAPCVYGPLVGPRRKFETLCASLRTPRLLSAAGVLVAFQSAGASEAEWLAPLVGLAVREGLDADEALRCLTINAARILGVDSRLGSIDVGKDADLALFDGDPLSNLSRCLATWVDGRLAHAHEALRPRLAQSGFTGRAD